MNRGVKLCEINFSVLEMSLVQSGHASLSVLDGERKLVDIYREKPVRLTIRVAVPVKEHPKVRS